MGIFLVTGASGFVGRALCRSLRGENVQVRAVVRTASQATLLPDGVVPIAIDIGPDTDWLDALKGVDTIVHMAARVHVMNDSAAKPNDLYRRLNVESTETLARMAAAAGVRRFIFVSSIKALGEESSTPYSEESEPFPIDPYGVSKWEAEQRVRQVARETGLEITIFRPPLIYGPGVKANFLKLLEIVERGIPLPFGSIENRRSFLFLGNLIDAIIFAASHPGAAGATFNISDGHDVSTPDLIRGLSEAFRKPARLVPFPPILMRMAGRITGKRAAVDRLLGSLVIDSGKICRDLGWKPPFTMQEGLTATARWYRDRK